MGIAVCRLPVQAVQKAIHTLYSKESPVSKKGKEVLTAYSKSLGVVRSFVSLIGLMVQVPKSLPKGLRIMKGPMLLSAPCAMRDLIGNARKIASPKSSLKKRVMNIAQAIPNTYSLGGAAATACDIAHTAGLVGKKAVAWLPYLGYFGMAAGVVSLALTVRSVFKTVMTHQVLRNGMNAVARAKTVDEKAEEMQKLLVRLKGKKIEKIARQLKIGKEANLAQKIDTLAQRLSSEQEKEKALQSGEEMLKVMRTRSLGMIGLGSFKIANSLISLAGSILLLTPAFKVGVGLSAVSSTMSFISWSTESFFIKSNPFDAASRCRAGEAVHKIGQKLHSIKNMLGRRALCVS